MKKMPVQVQKMLISANAEDADADYADVRQCQKFGYLPMQKMKMPMSANAEDAFFCQC